MYSYIIFLEKRHQKGRGGEEKGFCLRSTCESNQSHQGFQDSMDRNCFLLFKIYCSLPFV